MELNRQQLKARALGIMSTSVPKVTHVGLIYLLLSVVVSTLSMRLVGINLTNEDLMTYTQYVMEGNFDYALAFLGSIEAPSAASYLIDMLLQLCMWIVGTGFIVFLLNTIRKAAPCFGNLLDGFGFFWRIIALNLLEAIFVGLWSLLLFFPGIIAAYRYRMAIYLLIDHPEMSVMACLRESKRIMKGRKWELFVLDISFIGWELLASMPIIGYLVQFFTLPYISMTKALYYEQAGGRGIAHGPEGDANTGYVPPPV